MKMTVKKALTSGTKTRLHDGKVFKVEAVRRRRSLKRAYAELEASTRRVEQKLERNGRLLKESVEALRMANFVLDASNAFAGREQR